MFQDSDFAGDLNIRETLVHIRNTHVRANMLDVQETDFSFTQFQKAEIISLDAGLRMDVIPAFDLWIQ